MLFTLSTSLLFERITADRVLFTTVKGGRCRGGVKSYQSTRVKRIFRGGLWGVREKRKKWIYLWEPSPRTPWIQESFPFSYDFHVALFFLFHPSFTTVSPNSEVGAFAGTMASQVLSVGYPPSSSESRWFFSSFQTYFFKSRIAWYSVDPKFE